MRRPSNAMPQPLCKLCYNGKDKTYDITEDGILYQLTFEQTRLIRDYFKKHCTGGGRYYPFVSQWYASLDKHERKKVIRSGNVREKPDEFWPD